MIFKKNYTYMIYLQYVGSNLIYIIGPIFLSQSQTKHKDGSNEE